MAGFESILRCASGRKRQAGAGAALSLWLVLAAPVLAEDTVPVEAPRRDIVLNLPPLPEAVPAFGADSPPAGSVAGMEKLDLPDLPAITVTLEMPAPAPVVALSVPLPPDAPLNLATGIPFSIDAPTIRAELARFQGAQRLKLAEIDGMVGAYQARLGQPIWIHEAEGRWVVGDKSTALRQVLAQAGEHGLDADAFLALLPATAQIIVPEADRAVVDLHLSLAAFLYAKEARGGRLDPSRLSALITIKPALPSPDEVLTRLGASDRATLAATLEAYQPRHAGYLALKAKLAEFRLERERADAQLLTSATLKVASTASVLRDAGATKTPAMPQDAIIADILANMERWRWLPPDLGDTHIFVNVPEFKLSMVQNGAIIHQTRVIVGKPETPTPVFSDQMQFLIVNPSWHIPPSILRKEILPGLAKDPDYARKRGYEVVQRGKQISVRQPPGERNALGYIKFMFPNQHSVYLHDTPTRHLFASEKRAFSHGCVRVEAPFQLAERVLGAQSGYSAQSLRAMVGRGERTLKLGASVPIHLTYFTLGVDANGALIRQGDIYGHDKRMKAALSL